MKQPINIQIKSIQKDDKSLIEIDINDTIHLLDILIKRHQVMEILFSITALKKHYPLFDRVNLENLVIPYVRELKMLESSLEKKALEQILQEFDRDALSTNECSYQYIAPAIDYYYQLSLLCQDYLKLLVKVCHAINSLYQDCIVPKKGKFNKLDTLLWDIIKPIKSSTDVINLKIIEESFCCQDRFIDKERLDSLIHQIERSTLSLFVSNLSLDCSNLKQEFLLSDKKPSSYVVTIYQRLLELKSTFQLMLNKSDVIVQLKEIDVKLTEELYPFILTHYFNAYTTGNLNQELFKHLLESGKEKLPEELYLFFNDASALLYPIQKIKKQANTEDKKDYACAANTLIKFSQEYDILIQLYQEIEKNKPFLANTPLALRLKNVLAKITALKIMKKSDTTDQELKETIELYRKLLISYQETQSKALAGLEKKYVAKHWSLLKTYILQFSVSYQHVLHLLNVMPREELLSPMLPLAMQEKIKADFKGMDQPFFIVRPSLYPYLAEIYENIIESPYYLTDKVITDIQKKKIKNYTYVDHQQKSHKKNKKKSPKESLESFKEKETGKESEQEVKEEHVEASKPIKKYKRLPKQQTLRRLSWLDYMKDCEEKLHESISCVSIEHESDKVVIMRHWRGYNSLEQMTLFLYPVDQKIKQDKKAYFIEIHEENLPKMVDSLATNWDRYHTFSQEVESRYLTSHALIVNAEDKLAHKLKLNLSTDEYALCIRVKFMHTNGHYSPEFALKHKNNPAIGVNGYLVYRVNNNNYQCYHRFFHRLDN